MKLKMFSSYSTLSRESLKKIYAGNFQPINSELPDCDTIPRDLWKMVGCGQPITPGDCDDYSEPID